MYQKWQIWVRFCQKWQIGVTEALIIILHCMAKSDFCLWSAWTLTFASFNDLLLSYKVHEKVMELQSFPLCVCACVWVSTATIHLMKKPSIFQKRYCLCIPECNVYISSSTLIKNSVDYILLSVYFYLQFSFSAVLTWIHLHSFIAVIPDSRHYQQSLSHFLKHHHYSILKKQILICICQIHRQAISGLLYV